jgi:hypothetical protein
MDDPLLDAKARVQRYWNVDGLHEIAIAILFLLTAVIVWAGDSASLPKFWRGAAGVAFPIVLMGGIFLEPSVVRAIRNRLTFPRTGYVAFGKAPVRQQGIAGVLAFCVAVAVAVLLARSSVEDLQGWLAPALSVLLGGFTVWMGRRYGLPRFLAVAVFSVAAGFAIGAAGLPLSESMAAYWLAMGVAMLTSGTLALLHFLHAAPAASGDE